MRLLLDEMLDRRLAPLFAPEAEARTVRQQGWNGRKNGELLSLAQREFDIFLTTDRGIEHQQNLEGLNLSIILLRARSNAIEDVALLVDDVKEALRSARAGSVVRVPEG